MSKILYLLLILSSPAWAIKGEYIQGHDLGSTCKLTFHVQQNGKTYAGTCSASFIGNKTFMTAEHCYEDIVKNDELIGAGKFSEKSYFTCPGSTKKYTAKNLFPMKSSRLSEMQDLAMIKVEQDVDAPAIKLPASSEEIEEALKNKEHCYVSGYGLDNDEQYGSLKTARVSDLENSPKDIFSVGSTQRVRLRGNYADHGDSGGPLYCETPKGVILIGVVHGGVKGAKFGDIEKINQALEWMTYHQSHNDSNEELFKRVMINSDLCDSLVECSEALKKIGELTNDTDKIMQLLIKTSSEQKISVIYGEEKSEVKLSEYWEEMIEQWKKNDCYNKLYPPKD